MQQMLGECCSKRSRLNGPLVESIRNVNLNVGHKFTFRFVGMTRGFRLSEEFWEEEWL